MIVEQSNMLLSRLRALRTEISYENNVPPYVVFSNKTLEEMAACMPTTREALMVIYGVGKTKFDQYGDRFLAEIKNFKIENNITESFVSPRTIEKIRAGNQEKAASLDIVVAYPEMNNDAIQIENYDQLKAALQEILSKYESIVYTPDQLQKAKKDRAMLNKLKRAIATRSKEIKDTCLEPFRPVEAQFKELKQMIDVPLAKIAEFTSEMTQVQKDTKSATVKIYYDQKSLVLGSLADKIFSSDWFYNKKWDNKTYPEWQWQREIDQKIERVQTELRELSELSGSFAPAVITKYIETGDKDLAIELIDSIKLISNDEAEKPDVQRPIEKPKQANEMLIKIKGTPEQQQAVLRFLNELGLWYQLY